MLYRKDQAEAVLVSLTKNLNCGTRCQIVVSTLKLLFARENEWLAYEGAFSCFEISRLPLHLRTCCVLTEEETRKKTKNVQKYPIFVKR